MRFSMALVLSAWLLASPALAQQTVGSKPEWAVRTMDGSTLKSKDLEGRLVLMDFWATWCGPCMNMVPHMVELNEQLGPKGLVIVGVSLDRTKAAMAQVVQARQMKWVHSLDTENPQPLARMFGVNAIPHVILFSTSGELIWQGHPAQMKGVLEAAFKKYPPSLLDRKLRDEATATLEKAEAALANDDRAGAMRLLARIPEAARTDATLGERITKATGPLSAFADEAFKQAVEKLDQKDYGPAMQTLEQLSQLPGLPAAGKAADKLKEIKASPDGPAAAAAAEKIHLQEAQAAKADDALSAARQLEADKKAERAYAAYKAIVAQYAGTPAATEAGTAVARMEKDPAFVKHVTVDAAAAKARSLLSLARSYQAAGRPDLAKGKYQAVIDQYPATPQAAEAKAALKELGQQ